MKKIIIVGSGGHGKSVLDCALSMKEFDEIAFLVNHSINKSFKMIPGFRFFEENETSIKELSKEYKNLVVAIGHNALRLEKIKAYKATGFNLPALIHHSAVISELSSIGEGTVILANASVNAFSKIGNGCIVNTKANVDHDTILEDGVHLSPEVSMGGTVHIGEKTWLGVGCTVKNNITIGSNSVIGMGSVVIRDLDSNIVAYGSPCRVVRNNKEKNNE